MAITVFVQDSEFPRCPDLGGPTADQFRCLLRLSISGPSISDSWSTERGVSADLPRTTKCLPLLGNLYKEPWNIVTMTLCQFKAASVPIPGIPPILGRRTTDKQLRSRARHGPTNTPGRAVSDNSYLQRACHTHYAATSRMPFVIRVRMKACLGPMRNYASHVLRRPRPAPRLP